MDKRAQVFDMWILALRIFYLGIALTIIVTFAFVFAVRDIDVFDAETNIFAQRTLYASDSLSFHDPVTNRVFPGVIDLDHFNEDFVDNAFFYGDKNTQISARFTLKYEKIEKIVYYNRVWFQNWIPYALAGVKGPGGADINKVLLYVLVKDDDKLVPASLTLEVVKPRG